LGKEASQLIFIAEEEKTEEEKKKEQSSGDKTQEVLLSSKLLSGGIENRFLSVFPRKTKGTCSTFTQLQTTVN